MEIRVLVDHCDELLDARSGEDYGPNGLQVEGTRDVRKVATGVSACVELFERARDAGADAVVVHHGVLWQGDGAQPLIGYYGRRMRSIVESGLHLVAYHLPLDRHLELGNNVLAARGLGLYALEPWGEHRGLPLGCRGRYPEPVAASAFVERCRTLFGQEPLAFLSGPDPIATVGVVTGAAPGEIRRAIDSGLDAFVTGEANEWVMNVAREAGIHFLACGHHATERLGVRALGEHLAARFGLEHLFLDVPNPV